MGSDEKDDLNYFRFLTASERMGYEDDIVSPLFGPLSTQQLHSHFHQYNAQERVSAAMKTLHLYMYIPFCASTCSYCQSNRMELDDNQKLRQYVEFIIKQINEFSPLFDKTMFGAFTILGGTPSLLSAVQIKTIFEAVKGKFLFHPQSSFNFEGHPSSLSMDKLGLLKELGVGKIHIGVQSLDDGVLKRINRHQTRKGVERCIKNVKKLGFSCVNVDILAGLPGQTTASFIDDIRSLVGWGVDLINIYPFSAVTSANCYKNASESLQDVLKRRHEMIIQAKTVLEGYGYGNKGQRGYFRHAIGESQKVDPYVCPGGVLGLGLFAKSNLPGELVFECLPCGNDLYSARYMGYPIDKHYAMAQYAFLHLLDGLDTKAFQRIFGEDFLHVFGEDIESLVKRRIVAKNNEGFCYSGSRTPKGLFDYFAHVNILLGKKMIAELRQGDRFRYNSRINYGSKEHLLQVLQNLNYAQEYYQLGNKEMAFWAF